MNVMTEVGTMCPDGVVDGAEKGFICNKQCSGVLQYVAVRCSVWQRLAVSCSALQRVAVCCSGVAVHFSVMV